MAKFETAFGITNKSEGGYSNNIDDHGGETYAGISRKNWPDWHGWIVVDAVKKETTDIKLINKSLNGAPSFQGMIKDFYRANFWNPLKLDQINDQQIANSVYDFGVNSGTSRSAKTLQQAAFVPIDGIIGNQTLTAVNTGDAEKIYGAFNSLREHFYRELAKEPGQSQFLHSWLSRLVPYS